MTKKLIFLHIPKTAGSTFIDLLQNQYGNRFIRIKSTEEKKEYNQNRHLDNWDCFAGHNVGRAKFEFDDGYWVTFMRHPVERIISLYYFYKRTPSRQHKFDKLWKGFSLIEFARTNKICGTDNDAVRMICDAFREPGKKINFGSLPYDMPMTYQHYELARSHLDKFEFVGLQEKFGESVDRLAQMFDWSNVSYTDQLVNTKHKPKEIDQNAWFEIAYLNRYDMMLYEEVVRKFNEIAN